MMKEWKQDHIELNNEVVMLFAILGEECNFSLKLQAFRDLQIKHTNFLECFIDASLESFNAIQIQNQALHRIAKCDERESNTS